MFKLSEFDYVHYSKIDSTNTQAKRLIASGAVVRPTIVHADLQTGGRGSNGRSWSSKPENVQVSYVLPVNVIVREALLAVYPLALAASHVVSGIVGDVHMTTLKWPNDVLVDGCKVSGTLNEVETCEGRPYLIVGIGVNLTWSPDLTDGIYPPAALNDFVQGVPQPVDVVRRLANAISDELRLWSENGFEDVRRRYEARAHHLHSAVVLRSRSIGVDPIKGIYAGIDSAGAMLLDTAQGRTRHYSVDVFPTMERLLST